ncbi:glycosyltransferase family 25 protein [Aeoliella sp.]|uniref:glycosyltransferase family 25 protein n=1 Tax=Aeoliella sp. TaxID=2795800 RepID=UPI003CCBEB2B
MRIEGVFERVVCINLRRRADRWAKFQQQIPADWPFRAIERFEAIDGSRVPPPRWYDVGDAQGAWGCLVSHLRVWESALSENVESVLVFEDDAVLCDSFVADVREFLEAVPENWDQIWLGGDHAPGTIPTRVNDSVFRPDSPIRTHCYAVRSRFMRELYHDVCDFNTHGRYPKPALFHVDHQMSRLVREGQYNVYCPARWLVGQLSDISDVSQGVRHQGTAFYNDVNPIQQGRFRT